MKTEKHQRWRKSFPHYKVQFWDKKNNCWHDIQKSFSSIEQADKYGFKLNKQYRVMVITREGRHPL